MKNKQRTTNTEDQKVYFLDKVRENPKLPKKIMSLFLLFVLPFCIIFIVASLLTMKHIRNDAYTYTDDAYRQITTAIMGGPIILEDGTVKELPPCVQKDLGIDVMTLKEYVDFFSLNYENEHATLVCSIKKGYFVAKVTTEISNDYEVISMVQNFNSLGQYTDTLLHIFVLGVLFLSLLIYLAIAIIFTRLLALYGYIYRKLLWKKNHSKLKKQKIVGTFKVVSLEEGETKSPSDEDNAESSSDDVSLTTGLATSSAHL